MTNAGFPKRISEAVLHAAGRPRCEAVLALEKTGVDAETFAERLAAAPYPTVVRKYLAGTALEGLTFADIRASAGDHLLSTVNKPRLIAKAYPEMITESQSIRLRDYLDNEVLSGGDAVPALYETYRNLRIPKEFRAALGLIRPSFLRSSELNPPCIWIGKAGNSTGLHTDPNDNFVLICIGRKRFHLFPPDDLAHLSLEAVAESSYLISPIDPRNPDFERFPEFRRARGMVIDLEAGDLFYLPLGWAHFVETPVSTFAYNYWLKPEVTPIFKRNEYAGTRSAVARTDD